MGTPFSDVDNLFLEKISDDMLLSMRPEDIQAMLDNYRRSAGVRFKLCPKTSDRDLEERKYNQELTDEEQEILANIMVIEWIKPRINSIELLETTMSTKDYQTFSNANHLRSLQALYNGVTTDIDRMIVSYSYSENNLESLGGGMA